MRFYFTFISILLIITGFIAGNIYSYYFSNTLNKEQACNSKYELLNSFSDCITPLIIKKQPYSYFVNDLENYIDGQKKKGNASSVSVYFRDLVAGPTFGIDEKESFVPASLLKLPLLISYLSLWENDDSVLDQEITFKGQADVLAQSATSSSTLTEGRSYTVALLLAKMTIESDNLAYLLLYDALDKLALNTKTLEQTMIDLGLISPRNPTEDIITVKSYASLFRQLYNASYLSPKSSQYALELLSKSIYKKGLSGGIPNNIKVAHKFGERSGFDSEEVQLHDCGIVYYPQNPYLICIMTKGQQIPKLQRVISEISRMVYKEIDSRKL